MRRVLGRLGLPEVALVVATAAAGLWAAGRWCDPSGDTGLWWSLIARLGQGERYARDVFIHYWPLSPYLLAGLSLGTGLSSTAYMLLHWVPAIAAGVLLLVLARTHLNLLERLAVAALAVAVALLAPGNARLVFSYCPAAVHALVFALTAFLLLASPAERPGRWVGAGVLAGLAFCAKQEIGLASAAGLAVVALLRPGRRGPRVLRFAGAFAVVTAGGFLVLLSSAPLSSLRADSHLWPFGGPLPETWSRLFRHVAGVAESGWWIGVIGEARWLVSDLALLALAALLIGRERRASRWLVAAAVLATAWLAALAFPSLLSGTRHPARLAMSASFLAGILAWRDRRLPNRELLVGFALFAGLMGMRLAFSGDLSGPYAGVAHLASCLTSVWLLCVLLPPLFPEGEGGSLWARRLAGGVLLAVGLAGFVTSVASLSGADRSAVETPRGRVWVPPERRAALALVGRETKPGERVLALPEVNGVDVLFGLHDVSPYPILLPGWLDARAERILIERLGHEPPDVVVVFDRATSEFGVGRLGEGYGRDLLGWIAERYRLQAQVPGARIYRPAAGVGSRAESPGRERSKT